MAICVRAGINENKTDLKESSHVFPTILEKRQLIHSYKLEYFFMLKLYVPISVNSLVFSFYRQIFPPSPLNYISYILNNRC